MILPVAAVTSGRAPPSVPPRNGSTVTNNNQANTQQKVPEAPTVTQPKYPEVSAVTQQKYPEVPPVTTQPKYFDTNISAHPHSDSVTPDPSADTGGGGGGGGGGGVAADVTDNNKNNNYREAWKSRAEVQNTLVFNFVNSKKDVSHIENDGLDLTKRTKKVRSFLIKIMLQVDDRTSLPVLRRLSPHRSELPMPQSASRRTMILQSIRELFASSQARHQARFVGVLRQITGLMLATILHISRGKLLHMPPTTLLQSHVWEPQAAPTQCTCFDTEMFL